MDQTQQITKKNYYLNEKLCRSKKIQHIFLESLCLNLTNMLTMTLTMTRSMLLPLPRTP